MKVKLIVAVVCFAACAVQLAAMPARPGNIKLLQPDGTVISVQLHGDEYFHYMTTPQGAFVTECADGYYRYARLDDDNSLVATEFVVTDNDRSLDASLPLISDVAVRERLNNIYISTVGSRRVG